MGLRLSPGNCCGPVERCLFNGVLTRAVINELCATDFRERTGSAPPVPLPYIAGPSGVVDLTKPVKSGVIVTHVLLHSIRAASQDEPFVRHYDDATKQKNVEGSYISNQNIKQFIPAGTYRLSYAYLYFYGITATLTEPGYNVTHAVFPVDEQAGTAQGWEDAIEAIGYLKAAVALAVYDFDLARYTNPECLFTFCTCREFHEEGQTVEEQWQDRRAGAIVPFPTPPEDYVPAMAVSAEGGGRWIVYGTSDGCLDQVEFAPTPPSSIEVPFGVYACKPQIEYSSTSSPVSLGNSSVTITRLSAVTSLLFWQYRWLQVEITYQINEAVTAVVSAPCGGNNTLSFYTPPLYVPQQVYAIWEPISDRTTSSIDIPLSDDITGGHATNESGISRLTCPLDTNTIGPHVLKVYGNTRVCSTLSEAEAIVTNFVSDMDSWVNNLELRHAGQGGGITTKSIATPGTLNPCSGGGITTRELSAAAPSFVTAAGSVALASSAALEGLCVHAVPTATAWPGCTMCRVYQCHCHDMGRASDFGGLPTGKINEVPGETFYNVRSGFCSPNYCSLFEPR